MHVNLIYSVQSQVPRNDFERCLVLKIQVIISTTIMSSVRMRCEKGLMSLKNGQILRISEKR